MTRLERMSDAEFELHIHKLETEWRPQRVHSDYVERWLVVKYGKPSEPAQYATGLEFSSHEAARRAADGLNIAALLSQSARTAGWGV